MLRQRVQQLSCIWPCSQPPGFHLWKRRTEENLLPYSFPSSPHLLLPLRSRPLVGWSVSWHWPRIFCPTTSGVYPGKTTKMRSQQQQLWKKRKKKSFVYTVTNRVMDVSSASHAHTHMRVNASSRPRKIRKEEEEVKKENGSTTAASLNIEKMWNLSS